MKILITGGNGQLVSELRQIITTGKSDIGKIDTTNIQAYYYDFDELDITKKDEVDKCLEGLKPDVVINCAAYTNVDGCESNIDMAFKVNSIGPRNLAIACEKIDAKLIQISTDYVFSGDEEKVKYEFDITNPKSVYGTTKLLGENYVREFSTKYFIVRTAWLYGKTGKNFVYTMMNLAKDYPSINVVNDQKGNPTNANDLAYHILELINTEEYGIYHCTGEGECTWFESASKIIELSKEDCIVKPCTTEEFPRPAKRPINSSLDNMMLRNTIGNRMRSWEEAIECFMIKNVKDEGNR